ncbi:MAG: hypothetical protein ACOCY3_04270 [Desulfosalsimonas sp.]
MTPARQERKKIKKIAETFIFTGFLLLLLAAAAGQAAAHGTDHEMVDPGLAEAVEFTYADGSPMSYAEVLVYSPEDDETEHQNGRTDANGRFVFYPDKPGKWRIQADDGTGHLEKASVEISAGDEDQENEKATSSADDKGGQQAGPGGLPRIWAAVLGVSIILNIFSGFYFLRKPGGRQ